MEKEKEKERIGTFNRSSCSCSIAFSDSTDSLSKYLALLQILHMISP
jgi:hypothetical protein